MCKFFSFVMNDGGKIFYFNREQRLDFLKNNPKDYYVDSHASICEFYKLNEDEVNKYEYLGKLKVDTKCFDLGEGKQKIMNSFIKGLNLKELVIGSQSAYIYCRDIKDDPAIRKLIIDSGYVFQYCLDVKDRPSMRKLIIKSWFAYKYCRFVKDISSMRKLITDSYDAYKYCKDIKDDPEIRKRITDSYDAYCYCKDIKDRPSMRKLITETFHAYEYCVYVKDRPSMRKLIKIKALLEKLTNK